MPGLDKLTVLTPQEALTRVANVELRLDFDDALPSTLRWPPEIASLDVDVQLALARLARRAIPTPLPSDLDALQGTPRHAWDRVTLCVTAAPLKSWSDRRVLFALIDAEVDEIADPAAVLRRAAAGVDPDLALLALRLGHKCVARCALSPSTALDCLAPLAQHVDPVVRERTARAIAAPWLATAREDDGHALARALAEDLPAVAASALELLARAGDVTRLRALGSSPEVLEHLGECGDAGDLARGLDTDPAEVRLLVIAMHRRGIFPRPEAARALLDSFLADARWTADELTRVSFTVRDALLEELARLGGGDVSWVRLAALLSGSEGRVEARAACDILAEKLDATEEPEIAAALLDAAPTCPGVAEVVLVRWLDELPEPALRALRAHGDALATEAILSKLDEPLAFGSARREAVATLWAIAPDLGAVLVRLDARELPSNACLVLPDEGAAERILASIADAPAERRFATLATIGHAEHPQLETLFREAFRGEPMSRADLTPAERIALQLGARLVSAGRRVSWFGERDDAAWLRRVALDWLDEVIEDESRLAVRLLELLGRHGLEPTHLRRVHHLWRHGDRDVRRAAMETLIASNAEGLTLSLCSLASTPDLKASRQALRAIAEFEARWAEPLVIDALASRNMNVKKTAAETLAVVGGARSVPALVASLARYDNPGFRELLLEALTAVAGEAANGILLSSFEEATGDAAAMLLRALDRRLDVRTFRCFLRARRPGGPALRRAALEAEIEVVDGVDALRRALHLGAAPPAPDEPSPWRELAARGFSPTVAEQIVAMNAPVGASDVRPHIPEWTDWLGEHHDESVAQAVLEAIAVNPTSHAEAVFELAPRMRSATGRRAALDALGSLSDTEPRTRYTALYAARALGPLPAVARWDVLLELGGGQTRADLALCMTDARVSGEVQDLLRTALGGDGKVSEERGGVDVNALLEAHPIGISRPPLRPVLPGQPTDVQAWVGALDGPNGEGAASKLLASPEAHEHWPVVLECYLDGVISQPRRRLAGLLIDWPVDPPRATRAARLVEHLPAHRRRRWIGRWLDGVACSDDASLLALRGTPREDVARALEARGQLDENWASVLLASPCLTPVVDRHLSALLPTLRVEQQAAPDEELALPEDASALIEILRGRRGELAVRATGKLGALRDVPALIEATRHKEARVRTVGLRWLRRVGPREIAFEAAYEMLRVESQRGLRRSLVRMLAHGRHERAYPFLLELIFDKDAVIARAVEEALVRIGPDVVPTVRRAARRARPDRRLRIEQLLERMTPPWAC